MPTPRSSPSFLKRILLSWSKRLALRYRDELMAVIFDPAVEAKKVEQDATKGLVEASAVNFYAPDVALRRPKLLGEHC